MSIRLTAVVTAALLAFSGTAFSGTASVGKDAGEAVAFEVPFTHQLLEQGMTVVVTD